MKRAWVPLCSLFYLVLFWDHAWSCSGLTPVLHSRIKLQEAMWDAGIESRLAASRESSLPTVWPLHPVLEPQQGLWGTSEGGECIVCFWGSRIPGRKTEGWRAEGPLDTGSHLAGN